MPRTPNREPVRIREDLLEFQEPREELGNLLTAITEGHAYTPSAPIPLGLYFMLNRGDGPSLPAPLRDATNGWSRILGVDEKKIVEEAFALWEVNFQQDLRANAPLRHYLERVLILLVKLGAEGSSARLTELRVMKRERQKVSAQKYRNQLNKEQRQSVALYRMSEDEQRKVEKED